MESSISNFANIWSESGASKSINDFLIAATSEDTERKSEIEIPRTYVPVGSLWWRILGNDENGYQTASDHEVLREVPNFRADVQADRPDKV